jgi:hypothetical protein
MTAASLELSDHQYRNLLGIIKAVQSRPATRGSKLAAYVIVSAALAESGMQMYASANVPDSVNYPHVRVGWSDDGLGHDHASCGMLQQQTGTAWCPAGYGQAMNQTTMRSPNGWGTPAQLMDPVYSANKFLEVMETRPWQTQAAWVTAQDVQGSAYDGHPRPINGESSEYGGNYHGTYPRAQQLVDAAWSIEAPSSSPTPVPVPSTGGFMPDLTEAEQRRILAAADSWTKRLAKIDGALYALTNPKGYVQVTLKSLASNVYGLVRKG